MELERTDGRHFHFQLGPVEKWVIGIVASGFVGGIIWFASTVLGRLESLESKQTTTSDEQSDRLAKMETNQAVTNGQLLTLTSQLADIPQMRARLAEHEIRITRAENDVSEIRQMRGLR